MPQHVDRGIEVFDFTTNRLMMCGLGSNPIDCGVKVQKDLFTPRLGVAYRAGESMVFRAGFSRNPQNDNMIGTRMRNFPVNVQINDVAVGGNNFTPVGSFSDGYNLLPILNLNQPLLEVPAGVNITTNEVGNYTRGVITTFNVTAQKVLPYSLTAQVGYVGNRQNDMVRNQNLNYSQIGGGNASLPFNQPGLAGGFRTTAQVNTARPLGRVKYDALQASMVRRMTNGLGMTGAYTYAHATDWWAGGILIPEYWGLNKGTQNGNNRHKVDISATYELPFGEGRKYATNPGAMSTILSNWQVNTYFTAFTGSPFTVTAAAASLNANSPQVADQVKSEVGNHARSGGECLLVRPNSLQAGHRGAFRDGGFQHHAWTELRKPRSERVPDVPSEELDYRPVPAGDLQPDELAALRESRPPPFSRSLTTPTAASGSSMGSAPLQGRTTWAASMTSAI